jgi:hypothetical protein
MKEEADTFLLGALCVIVPSIFTNVGDGWIAIGVFSAWFVLKVIESDREVKERRRERELFQERLNNEKVTAEKRLERRLKREAPTAEEEKRLLHKGRR